MLQFTDHNLTISCRSTAITTDTGTTAKINVGYPDSLVSIGNESFAYTRRIRLYDDDSYVILDLANAAFYDTEFDPLPTSYVAPIAQVETATCVGTITGAGAVRVTITAAALGSPLVVDVPVNLGQTATQWAAFVRKRLEDHPTLRPHFTVSSNAANVVLRRRIDHYGFANDSSLNIAIAAGTATGITADAESTNTTAGAVAEGIFYERGDSLDVLGNPITGIMPQAVRFQVRGGADVKIETASSAPTWSENKYLNLMRDGDDSITANAQALNQFEPLKFTKVTVGGYVEILVTVIGILP